MTTDPASTDPASTDPVAPDPMRAIDADAVARLRLAMGRLVRLQRRASAIELTPSQQSALAMIDRHGPLSLGDLARLEHVAAPTVTRIVAKLEDDGLVLRTIDPSDRRVARVSITDRGHRGLEVARNQRNRWLAERLLALDPTDVTIILEAVEPLERLVAAAADPDIDRPDRSGP